LVAEIGSYAGGYPTVRCNATKVELCDFSRTTR